MSLGGVVRGEGVGKRRTAGAVGGRAAERIGQVDPLATLTVYEFPLNYLGISKMSS